MIRKIGGVDREEAQWRISINNMYAPNAAARNLSTTGGNFAKIFDIQNKRFITISCAQCGYTELYRADTSDGWNILDFLTNG